MSMIGMMNVVLTQECGGRAMEMGGVLIFQRGEGGRHGMKSRGCREHRRTTENAQDEILHNNISLLGLNPEVCAENFPYIRWRKTKVRLQQKFHIRHPHHTSQLKCHLNNYCLPSYASRWRR